MANYKKSKIYKITNLQNGLFYIGSTTRGISRRFKEHYKRSRKGTNKCTSSKVINGTRRKDIKIELLEVWPCNNRRELERREYIIINQAEPRELCVNIAGRIITPPVTPEDEALMNLGDDDVFLEDNIICTIDDSSDTDSSSDSSDIDMCESEC